MTVAIVGMRFTGATTLTRTVLCASEDPRYTRRMKLRAAVCLCLLGGCDNAKEAESAKSESKAEAKEEAKADAKAEPKADGEAKAEPKADEPKADAPAECPKELKGKQEGDLVISKACGTVPVSGTYRVDGGTLTLEAGATLAFADGGELAVGYYDSAKLIVNGTPDEPVKLTSAGDKAPGVWKGLRLHGKAARSSIAGLVVEYAGDNRGGVLVEAADVSIERSTIQHMKEAGLTAGRDASFAAFADNTFTDVGKVAMRLPAEVVGGLGVGNTFGESQRIVVPSGSIEAEAHWLAQGVPFSIGGDIKVNGKDGTRAKLQIDPGVQMEFNGNGRIITGYYAEAMIEARGTKDKPIVFTASDRKEAGGWRGLSVASKGEGIFEYARFEFGGKRDNEGVLGVSGPAHVTLENCTFADNSHGIVFQGKDAFVDAFSSNAFTKTPRALVLDASLMGGIGAGNSYTDDAAIEITGGTVGKDAAWSLQPGAVITAKRDIKVNGAKLELPAGFAMRFEDGASLAVGYYENATLVVLGTEAEPVTFSGVREEAGSWKGLSLFDKAKGNAIENLVLKNAGEPAVSVRQGAGGSIDGLTCEACAGEVVAKHDASTLEVENLK